MQKDRFARADETIVNAGVTDISRSTLSRRIRASGSYKSCYSTEKLFISETNRINGLSGANDTGTEQLKIRRCDDLWAILDDFKSSASRFHCWLVFCNIDLWNQLSQPSEANIIQIILNLCFICVKNHGNRKPW